MKSLFKDPVSWTESLIGTNLKFYLAATLQIYLGLVIFKTLNENYGFRSGSMWAGLVTVPPIFYLYAFKRVLAELKKEKRRG